MGDFSQGLLPNLVQQKGCVHGAKSPKISTPFTIAYERNKRV